MSVGDVSVYQTPTIALLRPAPLALLLAMPGVSLLTLCAPIFAISLPAASSVDLVGVEVDPVVPAKDDADTTTLIDWSFLTTIPQMTGKDPLSPAEPGASSLLVGGVRDWESMEATQEGLELHCEPPPRP